MTDLREDPEERRMFNEAVKIYGDNPLRQMAGALTIWHQMAPEQGSYGKTLAIYANECAHAADVIEARTARPISTAPRDGRQILLLRVAEDGTIDDVDPGPVGDLCRSRRPRRVRPTVHGLDLEPWHRGADPLDAAAGD
jgi:hypothetical protein